jgi:hypothetical protein
MIMRINLPIFLKINSPYSCTVWLVILFLNSLPSFSQVNYSSAASYSLRKTVPTYTGSAIQIRRACDNATTNIGFTSCGELDTVALKKFVVGSNPLSAIATSAAAAFSLRKLSCAYAGNAINVRRSCDNATRDIGFNSNGDLDTIALKTFVMASNPLSAISAGSAAAFSLRKLSCAYAGSAIQVRRSSDNTLSNIGFTANGDLDTASLKTFVGASNGFVVTWYDQSGNGRNATQGTTANQPRIINAGIIYRQNNMPAVLFSGGLFLTSTLTGVQATTTGNITTANFVMQSNNAVAGTLFSNGDPGANRYNIHTPWSDNSTYFDVGNNGGGGRISTPLTWSSLSIGSFMRNGTQGNIWKNGSNVLSTSAFATTVTSALNISIGGSAAYGSYMIGYISEITCFPSALSASEREYLEWSQSQYYNVSGPVLPSTLPTAIPSAFVATWYDQSGNGRNATQATTGNQPRIINAGIIEKQNGVTSIRFLGLLSGLATPAFDVFDAAACFNGVAKVNSNLTYNAIVSKTGVPANNNFPGPFDFYNNNLIVGNGTGATFFATSQNFNNTQSLGAWTFQTQLAGNKTAFFNGASILNSAGAAAHVDVNRPLNIGARNDGVTGLNGWISEIVTFSSIPSTTDRAFLEWTQGQYYNISGIALGTIPAGAPSAFITTWYDQSGNVRNATQSTAGNQPRIINSGAMSLQNGRPAISLNGTSAWLIQSTMGITQPYSLNTIATRTVNGGGSGGYQRLVNISATGDGFGYLGVFSGNYATFNGNGGTWNDIAACTPATGIALNSQAIMTMVSATGATGLIPSANGTQLTLKNGTSAAATGFLLGGAWSTNNTSQLWPGTISEFNIFSSALSTTRRTLLETNQASHYARTISNNKFTPPTSTTYNLFVNGIGRESSTDSVGGTRSTVGMGVSVTTAATAFLKDNGDYFTYGMNCRTTPHTSVANLPPSVVQRWENDWYVNKTDVGSNNGLLSIFFDFSDYGVAMSPGVAANYVLLYRSSSVGNFTIVPSTTVSTVGDRVVFNVDASSITTNHYYTIGTTDVTTSPLPIELLDFNCNIIGEKTVELKWTTATESNSDYFSVERSIDGLNYESIGMANGAGNSVTTLHYSLKDASALSDISYYRLKMVDLDGSYKYSPICSVTNQSSNNNGDVIIYPNPTNSWITVDFNHSAYSQPDAYSIMDITGKKIEVNTIKNNNSVIIDMSSLQPGMYMLEVIKGNQKSVKKITLQK